MIAAMMVPMTMPALSHIRVSTFSSRRSRATALFLLGFAATWLIPGLAMKALQSALTGAAASPFGTAAVTALVACIWQASPFKQRCLNGCHRHSPLSAFGLRADLDALRLGVAHGLSCIGTCWALMLLTLLLPDWHLSAMAAVAVLVFCERLDAPRPPTWEIRGLRTACQWLQREIAHAPAFGWLRQRRPRAEPMVREDRFI
ncbi:hypothetical protein GCM10027093_68600 [Paraburkholderia jirisanensis]